MRCRFRSVVPGRSPGRLWRWCRQRRRDAVLADYHADTGRRARTAVIAAVRAGVPVGPAPVGYRLRHHAAPAGGGRVRVRRLEPDLPGAEVVAWMFRLRVRCGLDPATIARRVNSALSARPANAGAGRGTRRRWDGSSVAAVLSNPVYTGRAVWGRTRAGRPVPPGRWIVSGPRVHPALVTDEVFLAAQPDHAHRVALARLLGVVAPASVDRDPDGHGPRRPGGGGGGA